MMLLIILEAAVRSMIIIAVVWVGLKMLRVRNPNILMATWQLVLAASLLMPFLIGWVPVVASHSALPLPQIPLSHSAVLVAPVAEQTISDMPLRTVDWYAVALLAYGLVAGWLLFRLVVGTFLTWRLFRSAVPVRGRWTEGYDVRASASVFVPVTFGSTILLPANYSGWDLLQRRAVMAHECAHVTSGDSYVLLLAAVHRAIFWFSPLAWWLHGRLADLAEERSDAAAIQDIEDRPRYAEILIDFGRQADDANVTSALSMARSTTVRCRVERILAETSLPKQMDWKAWSAILACVVPLVSLAAGAVAQAPSPSSEETKLAALDQETIIQRRKDQRRPRTAIQIDPAILDNYVGYYYLGSLAVYTITRKDDQLLAQFTGQDAVRVYPESPQKFFYRRLPIQISFVTDAQGQATGLVLHRNGLERAGRRVDQAAAQKAEEAFAKRVKEAAPQVGSEAALRRQIDAFAQGQPAYDDMTDELAALTRPQSDRIQRRLARLGPLQSLSFRGVGVQGWDVYEAKFANGISTCRIALSGNGKIAGLLFQWGP